MIPMIKKSQKEPVISDEDLNDDEEIKKSGKRKKGTSKKQEGFKINANDVKKSKKKSDVVISFNEG